MDYFKSLLDLLKTEREDDRQLYLKLKQTTSVNQRRAGGLTWYPIAIRDQEMSRGDYLTVEVERTTHHDVIHQLLLVFRELRSVPLQGDAALAPLDSSVASHFAEHGVDDRIVAEVGKPRRQPRIPTNDTTGCTAFASRGLASRKRPTAILKRGLCDSGGWTNV